jgi:4-aminobutyrate aminotransferase-like enzyme
MDLLGRTTKLGNEIIYMFKDAAKTVKVIGDVRGRGLMIGVEVVADRNTRGPLSPEKCGEIAMKLLNPASL